jgi:predicted transcriptional regulator
MEKKQVTFRLDPAIIKRLKFIALERDLTVTDLLLEAIQDLFKKYEKKPRKP